MKKIFVVLALFLTIPCAAGSAFSQNEVPVSDYDPNTLYSLGLAWDYPPYLLVDVPAIPGDAIFSQGPFPYIAPVLQKSGWITGHAGLYAGRKDHNNDGIEEFVTAEAARYGVWYGYFYPMYRFEKGHGRMDEYLKKDTAFVKFLKKTFGSDVAESSAVKKYDDLLDGTYMGARNVEFVTESPDEFAYRRKILEFAHNYVLKNSDYGYDGFKQPILSLFSNKNTNGGGGFGMGHVEKFTCVGLVEASFEYAGVDLVPKFIQETNIGLTPLKQFLYTKPVSKVFLKKGEKISFGVWHVINGHRTFEPKVRCENLPAGCSFDGKVFTADSLALAPGKYTVEFKSLDYPDQHQKVTLFVSDKNRLPNFDFKDVEKDYKGITHESDAVKTAVDQIEAASGDSKKDHDQKLLKVVAECKSVDDVVYAVRKMKNGAVRDIALLYSLDKAGSINDLYKLSMFTDSKTAVNKILYSPLGYRIQGAETAFNKALGSDSFSLLYNMRAGKFLKEALQGDYIFSRTVNIPLKISYQDISRMDSAKILGFIKFLCANPKELNRLENGYLISLIQKRVYFGIASKEPAAEALREQIGALYKKQAASLTPEQNANRSNIVDDRLVVARFLYTMAQSLDVDKKWLDTSLEAEKTFMKALAPALPIPGVASAVNSAMTETAVSPFAEMKIQGRLSPELASTIALATPAASVSGRIEDPDSAEPSAEVSDVPSAAIQAQAGQTRAEASAPGASAAYERYKTAYRKYVEALNAGTDQKELDGLLEDLNASSQQYQKLIAPVPENEK